MYVTYEELDKSLYHGSDTPFVLTDQAIDICIDNISGYIVFVVATETGKSIDEVAEAFFNSKTYSLLSDKETGYYWDSLKELIEKFKDEIEIG